MKRLLALAVLVPVTAYAADPLPTSPLVTPTTAVEFTDQEMNIMVQMCDAAKWASRVQFETSCDALKNKFTAAKSAANKSDRDKSASK